MTTHHHLEAIDPDRLLGYSLLLFSKLEGAVTAAMVHLGDRLGLYRALAARGPSTSVELAEATALHERWVREWLHNQAAAGLVAWEAGADGAERFWLTTEAVAVTADEEHPAFGMGMFDEMPATMGVLERLPHSFSSGLGLPYDALGPEGARGVERGFAPWYRNFLVPAALPALDGVVERLKAGARVADLGCGAGFALLTMATAFPASRFHGYDISHYALARAETHLAESGLANVAFHDAGLDPLPSDGSFDLVTTFDVLHDMTDPAGAMRAVRAALKPDGTWLIADIKGKGSFAENAAANPLASMMYGISVLSCMSSALSAPGGAGLGTLGLHEELARAMTGEAGFSRFRRLEIDHPVNAFYEVRP
ncbi:MAG: methyltransferase domain-containing protein [Acidimicrobiales bacterium]|nr:methyltransferase domain-containing protein [Acidimicrobiales bacterium]